MPIPRRYSTDAIVLSRFDLGEADRVHSLLTPPCGTLKALAKGLRRPTSRLGGSLEPFAELNLV
ncbi:MAG: recombination protein O N-terminal domain-containing protein, partial [Chloroflexota bacterium]